MVAVLLKWRRRAFECLAAVWKHGAGNRTGRAGPVVSEEFLADLAKVSKPKAKMSPETALLEQMMHSGAAVQRVSEEFLADLAKVSKPKAKMSPETALLEQMMHSNAAVQRADSHECVQRLRELIEQAAIGWCVQVSHCERSVQPRAQ
jgi:hypothetical protein